ncbi:MAG: hypothetical protein P1U89_20775 [Verrucomicrobiales bacterium]|nr:hypothetical protein [Verrucomicrobiales bacterium]
MIKPVRMVERKQDCYSRKIFLIEPLPEAGKDLPDLEVDSIFLEPTVIMTESVPFEQELEGWQPAIKRKAKEAFLIHLIEFYDGHSLPVSIPDKTFDSMEAIETYFDQYWSVRPIQEYLELEVGSWKTHSPHKG